MYIDAIKRCHPLQLCSDFSRQQVINYYLYITYQLMNLRIRLISLMSFIESDFK